MTYLTRRVVETNLSAIGLQLPPMPPGSKGSYSIARQADQILQTSALGPFALDGSGGFSHVGTIGGDITLEEGHQAAIVTGLNLVAAIDSAVSIEAVEGVVQVVAYLRSTTDFIHHARVADGVSSVLIQGFGEERGSHARTVVGAVSLPFGLPIVASATVQLRSRL